MERALLILVYFVLLNFITGSSQTRNKDTGTHYSNKDRGQQNIKIGQGDQYVIDKSVTNKYYTYRKDKNYEYGQFLVDTKRAIIIEVGTIKFLMNKKQLQKPFYPLARITNLFGNDTTTLKIILNKNKLIISSRCFSFNDRIIFKMVQNNISNEFEKFTINMNGIEVKDQHDVPVYQINVDRKENLLSLNGLFFYDKGYMIISSKGTRYQSYPTSYYLMRQSMRDSIYDECRNLAYDLLQQ